MKDTLRTRATSTRETSALMLIAKVQFAFFQLENYRGLIQTLSEAVALDCGCGNTLLYSTLEMVTLLLSNCSPVKTAIFSLMCVVNRYIDT